MHARARLLLASNSPRRIDLLRAAGFQFEIVSPEVDECFEAELTLRELTALNAVRKGMAIARKNPQKIVLAADTLVGFEHEVLGKPVDLVHAQEMLRRLSGRTHEVCSTVFIQHQAAQRSVFFHEISRVRFRRVGAVGIADYISKVNPLDKAGAYAAQGFGAEIIERIDGSFTNVVGLPMERTIAALAEFEIHPS